MGAKQTRTGQQFLLFVTGTLIWTLTATGCLHGPPQPQGEKQLLEARKRFASGDYRNALEISQRTLAQDPASLADQSLFQIGMIYAHPDNPDRDIQKALQSFQGIIDRYPASLLKPEAHLWLAVLGQLSAQEDQIRFLTQRNAPLEKALKMQKKKISRLEDQLEKLKRIDIHIEEKKREAIPQTEELEENGNGKNSGS
jgi:tetratricopeptide (TPR) repeat protein